MEIDIELPFSLEELSLLDMHSVLNVLNVVQYQLLQMAELAGYPAEMDVLCDETATVAEALSDHEAALAHVKAIDAFATHVLKEVRALQISHGLQENMDYNLAVANLIGVFEILKIRAMEIVARSDNPMTWQAHEIEALNLNFTQMLRAIERNSKGSYHIVTNLAEHEEGDYLIHFDMTSVDELTILMPAVFQDVMRDLLANARKYTQPGGVITAGLFDNGQGIRFVVQDTGVGIPEQEIMKVVEFGYRASNAASRPTCGGGFGLTKAFYITKTFGGRMWIDSPVNKGQGTRIEIEIPRP